MRARSSRRARTTSSWRSAGSTPACIASSLRATSRSPSLPAHEAVGDQLGPEARAELAGERLGVVVALDPLDERQALRLAVLAVAVEEGVEDAGLGKAKVAVAGRQLLQRLRGRAALVQHEIEGGEEPGPV